MGDGDLGSHHAAAGGEPGVLGGQVVGDEIAVARALSDPSNRLLQAATEDIEPPTGTPAHLQM